MICLDSTFIIDLLLNRENAIKKLGEIKGRKSFTTAITEYEVMAGAYFKNYSSKKIEKIVSLFNSIPVLSFDSNAALMASDIAAELSKSGKSIGGQDCMIAGIMLSNNCNEIITGNKKHFERIPQIKASSY